MIRKIEKIGNIALIVVLSALILSVTCPVKPQNAPEHAVIVNYDTYTISQLITEFGGNKAVEIEQIAQCESSGNMEAIHYHDGGKNKHSYGLLQYQEKTWAFFEKRFNVKLDMHSAMDQIKMTKMALDNGYAYHWTCARKLGIK